MVQDNLARDGLLVVLGSRGVRADDHAEGDEEENEEEAQEHLHPVALPPGLVRHRLNAGLAKKGLKSKARLL